MTKKNILLIIYLLIVPALIFLWFQREIYLSDYGENKVLCQKENIVCEISIGIFTKKDGSLSKLLSGKMKIACGTQDDSLSSSGILEDLKKETGIKFSGIEDDTFQLENGEYISAKSFSVNNVSREYQLEIKNFFEGRDFVIGDIFSKESNIPSVVPQSYKNCLFNR